MYLLDSCTCIDLMRGKLPRTYERMRASSPKLFAIPRIVEAELLLGAEKSTDPAKTRYEVERFLAPFQLIDLGSEGAHHYAKIRAELEKQGMKTGGNDLIIAACALAHSATLITGNIREFKRVPHLQLEYWEEIPW